MPSATLGLGDWTLEPTVSAGLLLVAGVYVALWRRGLLRADDDTSAWFRPASLRPWFFALGIVTAFLALESPLDTGGDHYLLTLHMVQHLVLMMVSPPLVLLGIAGLRAPEATVFRRLRGLWTWFTRPWQAVLVFNGVMLLWHIPAPYNATLTNDGLHIVEHVTFVGVGVLFWWAIVEPVRTAEAALVSPFTKIAMLVVGGVPPTVLGFVFVMAHSAYYSFYVNAPRLWGLSALNDQQFAGVVMLGVGNLIYFLAITVIFLRMFGNPADDEADAEIHAAPGISGR
jgi:cytochrome c oxidase assembly factor CtaG